MGYGGGELFPPLAPTTSTCRVPINMGGAVVVGIGIDLEEITRFQRVVRRRPELVDQVYSAAEQQVFRAQADPLTHFAASFAIKEAVFKALGQGWLESELFWKDIELLSPVSEARPTVRLSGAALKRCKALGGELTLASISHCERLVMAQVVILSDAGISGSGLESPGADASRTTA